MGLIRSAIPLPRDEGLLRSAGVLSTDGRRSLVTCELSNGTGIRGERSKPESAGIATPREGSTGLLVD